MEPIGEGRDERFVIDRERSFAGKIVAKGAAAAALAHRDYMQGMDTTEIDLRAALGGEDVLEAAIQLERPARRLTVVLPPGEAGRAEAVLGQGRWDAKHYWQVQPGVMQYEFDEPLPAGPVLVRIPFARR